MCTLCFFTDLSRGNLEESFGHRADNKFARRLLRQVASLILPQSLSQEQYIVLV